MRLRVEGEGFRGLGVQESGFRFSWGVQNLAVPILDILCPSECDRFTKPRTIHLIKNPSALCPKPQTLNRKP